MALITLASLGHSAGTSTAALAITQRWERGAILIEADTNTTSSCLAGIFRGQHDHSLGLTQLLTASRHNEFTPHLIWQNSLELTEQHRVVPGFARLAAARTDPQFWSILSTAGATFDDSGIDIIVDLGRLTTNDPRITLMQQADLRVLVTGATLPDIASLVAPYDETRNLLHQFKDQLAVVDHDNSLGLIVVNRAEESYSPREISGITGLQVLGQIPWAPRAASAYSLGTKPKPRQLAAFHRAIDHTIHAINSTIHHRRQLVGQPHPAELNHDA